MFLGGPESDRGMQQGVVGGSLSVSVFLRPRVRLNRTKPLFKRTDWSSRDRIGDRKTRRTRKIVLDNQKKWAKGRKYTEYSTDTTPSTQKYNGGGAMGDERDGARVRAYVTPRIQRSRAPFNHPSSAIHTRLPG